MSEAGYPYRFTVGILFFRRISAGCEIKRMTLQPKVGGTTGIRSPVPAGTPICAHGTGCFISETILDEGPGGEFLQMLGIEGTAARVYRLEGHAS